MKKIFIILFCAVTVIGLANCGGQSTITPQSQSTNSREISKTYTLTNTKTQTNTPTPNPLGELVKMKMLPETVVIEGKRIIFREWDLSIEFPSANWQYDPSNYVKKLDYEGFMFSRKPGFIGNDNKVYIPTIGLMFYKINEGTDINAFSITRRTRKDFVFPTIESMFGNKDSELELDFPALGYFGHCKEEGNCSVYIIHAVNEGVGIQLLLEIDDRALENAKPEFYNIMKSLLFTDYSIPSVELTQTASETTENWQSMRSVIFLSEGLIYGGFDLSKGGDGKGRGVDAEGRITTCEDLSLNLTKYHDYHERIIADLKYISIADIKIGSVIIFNDSINKEISCHASMVTNIQSDKILLSGQYGPKVDGTYIIPGYSDLELNSFFPSVFRVMNIYIY